MAFQDAKARFGRAGARILGVSRDSLESHEKFAEKHGLTFPLLSDPDRRIHERFGVMKEKKMYGRTVVGIDRSTFLIDGEGRIRRIWRGVKVAGHADEVLAAARELGRR